MKELLVVESQENKMSSLEIAELMNKQHKNVIRDIKSLIEQEAINGLSFELVDYKDAKGEARPMYLLDFEATMTLITGYDAKRRSVVIKRWQELESVVANQPQNNFQLPDFTNPAAAAIAWAEQWKEKEQLQLTLTEQAPLVALATAISASSRAIKIEEYVKVISSQLGFIVGRNNFFEWLRFDRLLNNKNSPYQRYIDCGWFEVKESTYENKNTNGPVVCFTTLITGMGQVSILERFKKSEYFTKFLNKTARANVIKNLPEVRA